jgi:guanylate kinase
LARKQLNQAEQFDYVVLNDDVERATKELRASSSGNWRPPVP